MLRLTTNHICVTSFASITTKQKHAVYHFHHYYSPERQLIGQSDAQNIQYRRYIRGIINNTVAGATTK